MKSTVLLTTAIFLISAPSPDSKAIAEISAGFLSPSSESGLMAAELAPKMKTNSETVLPLASRLENEKTKLTN
jgi:hypothetical protein